MNRAQVLQGLVVVYVKEFEFYSQHEGKPQVVFKQELTWSDLHF